MTMYYITVKAHAIHLAQCAQRQDAKNNPLF